MIEHKFAEQLKFFGSQMNGLVPYRDLALLKIEVQIL